MTKNKPVSRLCGILFNFDVSNSRERKRTIGKLSKKELARLHSDPGFLKFARKQIQWYRENNPKINFYVPEWFTTLTRRSELATIKQEEVADVFAFVGKSHVKSEM